MSSPVRPGADVFKLEYPQSLGVFPSYDEAQKVVDHLADAQFPVENLCIVGTELKSVERVLGRRTWGTVLWSGVQSGFTTGLVMGLVMWLFLPTENGVVLMLTALGIGIVIGVAMQALSYWLSRGKRDFTSVSQTVATRYELLSEHKVAAKARELIAAMPQIRAAAFAPQGPAGYPPPGYPPPGYGYPPPGTPAVLPPGTYPPPVYPPGMPPGVYPQPLPQQQQPPQPPVFAPPTGPVSAPSGQPEPPDLPLTFAPPDVSVPGVPPDVPPSDEPKS